MRKLLGIPFLFFGFCLLNAQEFGGNPPSLRWRQIDTDTARILFPEGLDKQAQRTAALIHAMAGDSSVSLGKRLYKINVVLQNQTTIANGYVGLGPYRSEFFMTPSLNNFDLGSLNWNDVLALHEYRHVQQFNNFRTGASKLMYYLFGEDGLALAINASVPDWFYEGDAVYNETRLSAQGRGRLPFFLNQYNSLWLANKKYSWMKLRNGSLKDYVPNHYALGYLLVNYGYEKYGNDFWGKVTRDAAAFKGLFYPFQRAIKKYAGADYRTFTKEGFDFYKSMSRAGNDEVIATQQKLNRSGEAGITSLFPVNTKYVTNYLFPYHADDGSLIYLKNSYRHRSAFFVKDRDGNRRLRVKDISQDEQFSYRNGKIVYAAYEPDARWGWRNYSVIKLLDVQTGMQKRITKKTKYFSPDISPDGGKIVAVYQGNDGNNRLHILSAADGKLLNELPNPDNCIFTDPKFVDEEAVVSAVRVADGRMALAKIELVSGKTEWLTPHSYNVIGFPQVVDGMVYYTSSYAGNDEVYAVSLNTKRIFHVTSDRLGNYFVNRYKDSVVFSRFTSDGYQLMKMPAGNLVTGPVSPVQLQEMMHRYPVAGYKDGLYVFLQSVPERRFATKRYGKGTGLFNFHSWRPYYEDPTFTFSLYGENVLNTFRSELYYLYNQDEKTNAAGFSVIYGALFPLLSAGSEYTFNRSYSVFNSVRRWDQLDSRIGLSVPLNFTGGRSFRFLNFGSSYVLRNEFYKGAYKDTLGTVSFGYLSHFISYNQQIQQARQHIMPRLGYGISIQYRRPVSRYEGYQFYVSSSLYLPGFLSNHNLVLNGAFQQRDTLRALFANRFADARGYTSYYRTTAGSRMWRLSANYHLPLFLPDWGFGNVLYIQRVRASLFYDFQRLFSNNKQLTADLRSTGVEFYADTRWWNQYELTLGLRVNHLLDDDPLAGRPAGSTWAELILPVSIIPR